MKEALDDVIPLIIAKKSSFGKGVGVKNRISCACFLPASAIFFRIENRATTDFFRGQP